MLPAFAQRSAVSRPSVAVRPNSANRMSAVIRSAIVGNLSQGIFVATTGSDSNLGTSASPFLTPDKARQTARSFITNLSADYPIYFYAGRYELSSTWAFNETDSGTNNHYVVYQRVDAS